MDGKILFLRISIITGAVLDAILVLPLMVPKLAGLLLGLEHFSPDATTLYLMHVGAALMAGWTGILFWAAVKPIERRGIIPITLFPLLSGLLAAGVRYYLANGISLEKIIPLWTVSAVLMITQAIGYFITKGIKR